MGGSWSLTAERMIHESRPDIGYSEDIPVPLGAWRLDSGLTIPAVGAGIVGMATVAVNYRVIEWDDTADANDIIRLSWAIPRQFKWRKLQSHMEHANPKIVLQALCRVADIANGGAGGATANADLELRCQAYWLGSGSTQGYSLASPIGVVVGATDYPNEDIQGFQWRSFNITDAMSAAQINDLPALGNMDFTLFPHEQVGTDLVVQVLATRIHIVRHGSFSRKPTSADPNELSER